MSAVATHRVTGSLGSNSGGQAWTGATSAFSVTAGEIVLVFVGATDENVVTAATWLTCTAAGYTFTAAALADQATAFTGQLRAFTAEAPSTNATQTVTIGTGVVETFELHYSIYTIAGADTTDPVGATATGTETWNGTDTLDGAETITLDSAPATDSTVVAAIYLDAANGDITKAVAPGSGWTEDAELPGSGSVEGFLQVQQRTGSTSTSVDWADINVNAATTDFYSYAAVAVEIKAAAAGLTMTASGTGTTTGAAAISVAGAPAFTFPASISGRKVLDQFGDVYLCKVFSSWAMAFHLTNAEITQALQDVAANGFNGVTVFMGGNLDMGTGWLQYTNVASQNWWTGTPWASSLGAAWGSMDHLVSEAADLGITVHMSMCGGFGTDGCRADWEAVTNTNMYNAGVAVATRYASAENIVWHIMFDGSDTPSSTSGQRIEAFFDGINDTEGASARPVRWLESNLGSTAASNGWLGTGNFNATINATYDYDMDSAQIAEAIYAAVTTVPVGDSEPPYDGSNHFTGNMGQQLRERSYAIFIEGGILINYGHEDWYRFGAFGPQPGESMTWDEIVDDPHTIQQKYCWALLDLHVADSTWVPSSWVTAGEGSGDTKAAVGNSNTAALAYFPNSRTPITVDTTVIAGTDNVKLRWFDPTNNTYTVISADEAQNASRSVTHPGNNSDGQGDWVLVVESLAAPPVSSWENMVWESQLPSDDIWIEVDVDDAQQYFMVQIHSDGGGITTEAHADHGYNFAWQPRPADGGGRVAFSKDGIFQGTESMDPTDWEGPVTIRFEWNSTAGECVVSVGGVVTCVVADTEASGTWLSGATRRYVGVQFHDDAADAAKFEAIRIGTAAVGVTGGSAAIEILSGLSSAGTGTSTGSAAFVVNQSFSASAPAQVTTGTADLDQSFAVAASGTGVATGQAILGNTIPMSASGTGQSAGQAAFQGIVMSASGTGLSGGSVALISTQVVTTAGTGVSAGAAAISIGLPLNASGAAILTGSAAITLFAGSIDHSMQASGLGVSAGSAALISTMVASASGVGVSTGAALFLGTLPLSASGAGVTDGSVAIKRLMPLASQGTGLSGGGVFLTMTVVFPGASGTGQSAGAAGLGLALPLPGASGTGQTTGSAAIGVSTGVTMSASGTGTTTGNAGIFLIIVQIDIGVTIGELRADPHFVIGGMGMAAAADVEDFANVAVIGDLEANPPVTLDGFSPVTSVGPIREDK